MVKDICDRVAVMERGSVVEEGDTVSVFSHPKGGDDEKLHRHGKQSLKINELIAERTQPDGA